MFLLQPPAGVWKLTTRHRQYAARERSRSRHRHGAAKCLRQIRRGLLRAAAGTSPGLQLGCQRRCVQLHLLLGALQVGKPGRAILLWRQLLDALDGQRRRDDVGSYDLAARALQAGLRTRRGSTNRAIFIGGKLYTVRRIPVLLSLNAGKNSHVNRWGSSGPAAGGQRRIRPHGG